jgi:hypothetical protein
MKKILLAVTAALAIMSCSQNEEFEAPNQQTKIDFTSVVRKATRATDTNSNNFLGFTVSSYITDGDYNGTDALGAAYMDGISYTKDNAAAPWTTTDKGTYYWPSISSGKKVNSLHTQRQILRPILFLTLATLQYLSLLMALLRIKRFGCCTCN